MRDHDFDSDDAIDDDEFERRGVVWVTFVKERAGSVSYPMPGVPRVGEIVDLSGGQVAPGDYWQVAQVVWKIPAGYTKEDLVKLTLSEMTAVTVHLVPIPEQKPEPGGWFRRK